MPFFPERRPRWPPQQQPSDAVFSPDSAERSAAEARMRQRDALRSLFCGAAQQPAQKQPAPTPQPTRSAAPAQPQPAPPQLPANPVTASALPAHLRPVDSRPSADTRRGAGSYGLAAVIGDRAAPPTPRSRPPTRAPSAPKDRRIVECWLEQQGLSCNPPDRPKPQSPPRVEKRPPPAQGGVYLPTEVLQDLLVRAGPQRRSESPLGTRPPSPTEACSTRPPFSPPPAPNSAPSPCVMNGWSGAEVPSACAAGGDGRRSVAHTEVLLAELRRMEADLSALREEKAQLAAENDDLRSSLAERADAEHLLREDLSALRSVTNENKILRADNDALLEENQRLQRAVVQSQEGVQDELRSCGEEAARERQRRRDVEIKLADKESVLAAIRGRVTAPPLGRDETADMLLSGVRDLLRDRGRVGGGLPSVSPIRADPTPPGDATERGPVPGSPADEAAGGPAGVPGAVLSDARPGRRAGTPPPLRRPAVWLDPTPPLPPCVSPTTSGANADCGVPRRSRGPRFWGDHTPDAAAVSPHWPRSMSDGAPSTVSPPGPAPVHAPSLPR
eukprot:TRINITY_DN10655_c1_g1_i5.p1 TRINITY_DN10655_c1_g1~~TRINITY_DN10655_c1_g1_i5.p1  ORF type:complete len:573 (+),score=174.13 TRINITY_DN10655_c1_g1_i5:44-1720(+)